MVFHKDSKLIKEIRKIIKQDFANDEDAKNLLKETFAHFKSRGLSEEELEFIDLSLFIDAAKQIWQKKIISNNKAVISAFRDWSDTIEIDNKIVMLEVRKRVYGICLQYVLSNSGQKEDVEDLVNDVIIRFRNNCLKSDFQLVDSKTAKPVYYSKYIYGIIRFAWLDRLKARKKEGISYEEVDNLIAEKEGDLEGDNRISLLKEAIHRLSKAQKETITLFYFENLTIKEIEEYLVISKVAVKKRLYDGRQKLKEMLE